MNALANVQYVTPDGRLTVAGLALFQQIGTALGASNWGAIGGNIGDQADLSAAIGGKQAELVSGTNIKTINGASILGSGDLVISVAGSTRGAAVLSFGSSPGTGVAATVVSGQADIGAGATVKAWIRSDDTADHNAAEHAQIFASRVGVTAGDVVAGVGFTIFGETELRLTGDVAVAWEWSN